MFKESRKKKITISLALKILNLLISVDNGGLGGQDKTCDKPTFFPYLKDKVDIDLGIELDKEVLLCSSAQEKITCEDHKLFFNIQD
jgi:hypothetical protein